jgi:FtsP/CotA-like multicopper oxidase with cupredoxin domain
LRKRGVAGGLFPYFCSFVFLLLLPVGQAWSETREYGLVIDYTTVNFTGRDVQAMTINGGIPGPTIELTEGDFARIRVHNRMDVDTSVHWHGILLPNKEDGVPYVTTPPIKPGTMREFAFPVVQSGTYWYHSHTGLQEQRGVYGSIVIHPKGKRVQADREYVVVFSDWTDENPDEVMRTLKRGSEYYSLRKDSVQSLAGAIRADALGETFKRSLMRMPPMDISDVAYDLFLVNGRKEAVLEARPGEKVLLRVINASASTYFYLQFAGGEMSVVSADGLDVRPVPLSRLLIAVAETYDVLVTVPGDGSYEFRATAQDGSGHTAVFLGEGERVLAPDIPKPDLYRMHGAGHGGDSTMSHGSTTANGAGLDMKGMGATEGQDMHDMHSGDMPGMMEGQRPMPPYAKLFSVESTALSPERPTRTITLTLTGDMERYVWSFDGKVISEADSIPVRKGENLRIVFVNKTMMHHPLHLHGHFFRVVDGQGDHAPLKHTVDIAPLETRVIEFAANEEKDWLLHCHLLYHMKAGMMRVLHYEGSSVDPEVAESRKEPANFLRHDPWFVWGELSLLTQMAEGSLIFSGSRHIITLRGDGGWNDDAWDLEASYAYAFNRFTRAFGGINETDDYTRGFAGIWQLLPLNFEGAIRVDTEGDVRFVLEKEVQATSRLSVFGEVEYDTGTQWEGSAGAAWTLTKHFDIRGQYHSEYGLGAGVTVRF